MLNTSASQTQPLQFTKEDFNRLGLKLERKHRRTQDDTLNLHPVNLAPIKTSSMYFNVF